MITITARITVTVWTQQYIETQITTGRFKCHWYNNPRDCFMIPRYLNRRLHTFNVIVFPPENMWVGEVVLKWFFCRTFCLILEFSHRYLLTYIVGLYESSQSSRVVLKFVLVFVRYFVFYLLCMIPCPLIHRPCPHANDDLTVIINHWRFQCCRKKK